MIKGPFSCKKQIALSFAFFVYFTALMAVFLFPTPSALAQGPTYFSGNITSDTTWTLSNSPYVVSSLNIPSGKILTIEHGVVVKFSYSGAKIIVSGTLNAIGTQDQPIYFTSNKDDSIGGDINNDDPEVLPQKNNWDTIQVLVGGTANFNYSEIRYGKNNISSEGGMTNISNSKSGFAFYSALQQNDGTTNISNSEFHDSFYGASMVDGTMSIDSSRFYDNSWGGIFANASGNLNISNIDLQRSSRALYLSPNVRLTHENLTAQDNRYNGIIMSGIITEGQRTWTKDNIPYLIFSGEKEGEEQTVYINSGATLNIEEGVIAKFAFSISKIVVRDGGTLNANGTQDKPIIFTSIKEDQIDNIDSDGDGQTQPNKGSWDSIEVQNNGKANFNYSEIRYGRTNILSQGGITKISNSKSGMALNEALKQDGGTTNISGSEFYGSSKGIWVIDGVMDISKDTDTGKRSLIRNNDQRGLYGEKGSITVRDTDLLSNSYAAIFVSMVVNFTHSNLTAQNNDRNGIIIWGIWEGTAQERAWTKDNIPYVITVNIPAGKTLTIEPGVVVKFFSPSTGIVVNGTLNAIGTKDQPIIFTSIRDDFGGDTNNDGGATAPEKGTFGWSDWKSIEVNGGTMIMDNAIVKYGGGCCYSEFYNYGGMGASIFLKNSTATIQNSDISNNNRNIYSESSQTDISNSKIHTTDKESIEQRGGTLNISNSEIYNSNTGLTKRLIAGTTEIHQSSIHDNRSYGVLNSLTDLPSVVNATSNWWGSDKGPYHLTLNPGGNMTSKVTNNVSFENWLDYDPTKTVPAILDLKQSKEDGTGMIEGASIIENRVRFEAMLSDLAEQDVKLEVELKQFNQQFDGEDTLISDPVQSGNKASIIRDGLIAGDYHWRARAINESGRVSNWQEFGEGNRADFVIKKIYDQAIELAKEILGAPYLGDGKTWGGKGQFCSIKKFASSAEVKNSGYKFYDRRYDGCNPKEGTGLDCSGLVYWAYNAAYFGTKLVPLLEFNKARPASYEGAQGQYENNTDHISKDDLQTGDLLFFDEDSNGSMDHVAMFIGENGPNNVIHANGHTQSVAYATYNKESDSVTTTNSSGVAHEIKVKDHGRIKLSPTIALKIAIYSPANLIVTDPDGQITSIENPWEGPLEYQVYDDNDDGSLDDVLITGTRKTGEYLIKVVPKPDALPTDTYSLKVEALIDGEAVTTTLADHVSISNIPRAPYIIRSSETEIISLVPAFVDIDPNSLNLKSKGGDITAYIELPRGYEINDLNLATIKLNGQVPIKSRPAAIGDYDSNGIADLMVKFDRQAAQSILQAGEKVRITIRGQLKDGKLFEGSDAIKVISNGKPTSLIMGILDFIRKSTNKLLGLII